MPESVWLSLEKDLQAAIDSKFPAPRPDDFEIHATEISNPRNGYFKQFPINHGLSFRDEWFRIANRHSLKLVYRAISKKRFAEWCAKTFGSGIAVNPHVAAFPLLPENDPRIADVIKLAKPRPHWPKDFALNHSRYAKGDSRKK